MDTEASAEIDLGGLESAIQSANLDSNLGKPREAAVQQPQPTVTEKPVAKVEKPVIDTTPKKHWEKLESEVKKEEAAKPEDQKTDEVDDDLPADPPNASKEQKERAANHRRVFNELKKQVPDLQKQLEQARKDLEAAKTTGKPDEATLQELEELRTYRAARDIQSTPEYQDNIVAPIEGLLANIREIALEAKVDPEALAAATDVNTPWKRALAIKKVFESAEEAVPQELVTAAINESEKLWPIYEKAADMKAKAQELWQGLQNKGEIQSQKAKEEAEAKYVEHHNSIYDQLKVKAGISDILKNEEVAKALQAARPSDDPDDKAYSTMAGELLPHLTNKLKEMAAQIEKLEKAKVALVGARPGVTPGGSNGSRSKANGDDVEMDEGGLLDAVRSTGIGRRG